MPSEENTGENLQMMGETKFLKQDTKSTNHQLKTVDINGLKTKNVCPLHDIINQIER